MIRATRREVNPQKRKCPRGADILVIAFPASDGYFFFGSGFFLSWQPHVLHMAHPP